MCKYNCADLECNHLNVYYIEENTTMEIKTRAGFSIPKRYILGFMGFLGVVNAYVMRAVLSVAIIEMTKPIYVNSTAGDLQDVCPDPELPSTEKPDPTNDQHLYEWSEEIQGLVLGSFYWGYVLAHIPGGYLAEKFGGKWTLGLGILSTAIFTLITPMVVKIGDWPWLMVFRVLVGFGEGTTFPALNVLLAKWVPLSERSTIATLVYAGLQIGNVVGNGAGGVIIGQTKSWESVFYVFGCCGVIWFILWSFLGFSDPSSHPYIGKEEKKYLDKELSSVSTERQDIPWKAVLTSVPLWALVVAGIGFDWGVYTMLNDLPKYMKTILKFNVQESGLWSSLPYILMWLFSMISAWTCDRLIARKFMSITFARKFFTTISSVGSGVFLIGASYAGCDKLLTVILFTLGMGFMGASYCGTKVNLLDLSPNYAGTLTAIVNGIGALAGIITPYLAGVLTGGQTLSEWRLVFWITFVVFIVTNVVFVIFGSGEEQWWNFVEVKDDVEEPVELSLLEHVNKKN